MTKFPAEEVERIRLVAFDYVDGWFDLVRTDDGWKIANALRRPA